MVSKKLNTDMSSGPLFGKIIIFALPIMAMNILQLLFNTADMVVVGRFTGRDALAAVGASGALINLFINLFMGLSVGTSVIVAQDIGAGDHDAVSRSVHTSIIISVISGIIVMFVSFIFCEPLLTLMGTPDEVLEQSALYMKIYFVGLPASMVYNFGAAILRAIGDSKRPMYYLIATGLLNVALNLYFFIVFKMGVAGVAWATTISQYLAVFLIMNCLMKFDGPIRFSLKKLHIDSQKLLSILKIGLPAGLQGTLFSISNVLIQSAVNSFGTIMVAASTAAGNIESFLATTTNSYYNAAITFTGQNIGAKKYERIDSIAKVCTVLIFATWFILGGLTLLFGRPLLSIYSTDTEVIELGMLRMVIMMSTYFTCGVMNVFPGLTRGMGYSVLPMLCTLIGACLMRVVWVYTVFEWSRTVIVLFLCYPVTWFLTGLGQVVIFLYARKCINKKAKTEAELVEAV